MICEWSVNDRKMGVNYKQAELIACLFHVNYRTLGLRFLPKCKYTPTNARLPNYHRGDVSFFTRVQRKCKKRTLAFSDRCTAKSASTLMAALSVIRAVFLF